jgi:hypothetical protein
MSEYLPVSNENKFSDFSYLINNNFYEFQVYLGSFDGRLKQLKPSSIKMLNIENDLEFPFHQGYILLDNRQDNLESNYNYTLDPSLPQYYTPGYKSTNNTSNSFIFNGDSRDVLIVKILPKLSNSETNTNDKNVLKYFLLQFDFVIYNTEEIDDGTQDGKLKKLYFWELDYEILREKNSFFSTAKYLNQKKDVQDLSNENRRILTGVALSAAINEGLDKNDGFNPTFEQFDPGSTTIFFSSPGNFKYTDAIDYILSRHVSSPDSNFSPCILRHERYPKAYSLKSYYNIFKNALTYDRDKIIPGNEYLETFKIAGYTDNSAGSLPIFKVKFTPSFAAFMPSEGNIDAYSFDFPAGIYTQSLINTKNVHSYNYNNKQFNIETSRNSMENFDKVAQNNYVTPIAPVGQKTFQTGKLRSQNKNYINEFAAVEQDPNQRLSLGLTVNLKNYVYLNSFVNFRVKGATYRQAGKFIGITRDSNKQPSDFDNKFLGVYLITKVNHIFEDANYFNELVCVKTYVPSDLFLNKSIL